MAAEQKEERVFTIPLRKAFVTEQTNRGWKAMDITRAFLERHMKGTVKIGKSINESVWARGIKKPPRRIRVHATREMIDGGNVIFAELVGTEIVKPSAEDIKKKAEKEKEKEKKIKEERKERKGKSEAEKIKEEKEASVARAPTETKADEEKK
ncbi:MAG: 50S ribosomal protein L31e [Nanoarchaeota archaeon]|nr:50S ribosomal protein L31e [Nanoarchaeota archaeon]